MPKSINIKSFLELAQTKPIIDVRSPAEFEQGHIPGAYNIPLFSNEDRKVVGTLYKQQGRQAAILKGLEIVGPKLKDIVEQAGKISDGKEFLVHCWRGGMRSASVCWLLETYGFKTYVLSKGYKAFRTLVLSEFDVKRNIVVLGGKTGSSKTKILYALSQKGEQVADLEGLAHHKGSSFGSIGEEKQPTQEQFENELAVELMKTKAEAVLWLEDESRRVGNKVLPAGLWEQMRNTRVCYLEIPFEVRAKYLVEEYGKYKPEELKEATQRISKKIGPQHAKAACIAIDEGDLETACKISLAYYDRTYEHGTSTRAKELVSILNFEKIDVETIAQEIIKWKISDSHNTAMVQDVAAK